MTSGVAGPAELHRLDPGALGAGLRHVLKMTGGFFADEHYVSKTRKGEIYGFQEMRYIAQSMPWRISFPDSLPGGPYMKRLAAFVLGSPMAEIDELSRDGSALLISQESVDDLLADSECCQVVYPLKP